MNNLDSVSSEYLPNAATELENDLMLHWYPKRIVERFGKCDSLLELGLGHGFTSGIFNKACDRHVIIEGSNVVIEQFKSNNPGFPGEIIQGYFENYESDEKFDVILMGFILEHVDDPGLILDIYKKHLKPGGKLYVAVPNGKSLNRRYGYELGMIEDLYSLNENDIALGHKRQFCVDTMKELLQKHGYSVEYQEGIYLKPLPLHVLKTLDDFEGNLQAMLKVGVDFPEISVAFFMEVVA